MSGNDRGFVGGGWEEGNRGRLDGRPGGGVEKGSKKGGEKKWEKPDHDGKGDQKLVEQVGEQHPQHPAEWSQDCQ